MFKKACIVLRVNEKLWEVRTVQYSWPKICRNLHNIEMDSAGTGMLRGSITTSGSRWCGAPRNINIILRGVPLHFPIILPLRTKKKSCKKVQVLGEESSTPVRMVSSSARLWLRVISLNRWHFFRGSAVHGAVAFMGTRWIRSVLYVHYIFGGKKRGRRASFPLYANLRSRIALLAPAAVQNEGFSFTVPKVKLLVNADHSSLV